VRIHDAIKSGDGYLISSLNIMYLAVAITSVVSPIAVKQLVALYANGSQISVRGVVEQSITELGQTCTSAAGNDLMEWVKRIECIRRDAGLDVSRRVWWLGAGRNWRIRRDGQDHLTRGLEGSRGGRRQFVMCLDVLIHEVAVNNQLVFTHLVLEIRVTAPAFRTRERQRELVKVKTIEAARPIFIGARRS